MTKIQFRPLGEVLEIIQQIGFDISYAYDDLLFSEHNVFIIRFDQSSNKKLWLYFNEDCDLVRRESIGNQLKNAYLSKKIEIHHGGLFSVQQIEGKEELELKFFEAV